MKTALYIKVVAGKGRAVFSTEAIPASALIEECPLCIIPGNDNHLLSQTTLVDYFFHFEKEKNELAIALGFGSLYNHAVHPNAAYEIDQKDRCMRIFALADIPAGTEICFNYSGEPGNAFKEWFEARGMKIIS